MNDQSERDISYNPFEPVQEEAGRGPSIGDVRSAQMMLKQALRESIRQHVRENGRNTHKLAETVVGGVLLSSTFYSKVLQGAPKALHEAAAESMIQTVQDYIDAYIELNHSMPRAGRVG